MDLDLGHESCDQVDLGFKF